MESIDNRRRKFEVVTALHNVQKRSQKEQEGNLIKIRVSNIVCDHEEV